MHRVRDLEGLAGSPGPGFQSWVCFRVRDKGSSYRRSQTDPPGRGRTWKWPGVKAAAWTLAGLGGSFHTFALHSSSVFITTDPYSPPCGRHFWWSGLGKVRG